MDWFRWHHGTVNDPKWRVIARKSGQPVLAVIGVFAVFLERASQGDPRGSIEGWDADDIAAGLDMEPEQVVAIHQAMQGKVLDGDALTGWNKRQPKREREDDGATERKRAQREREKSEKSTSSSETTGGVTSATDNGHAMSRHVTPCHAQIEEREESREEGKKETANAVSKESRRGCRIPAGWQPCEADKTYAVEKGNSMTQIASLAEQFRNHHTAKGTILKDWSAGWRTWVQNDITYHGDPRNRGRPPGVRRGVTPMHPGAGG